MTKPMIVASAALVALAGEASSAQCGDPVQVQVLTSSPTQLENRLGVRVDLDGDFLIAGAPFRTSLGGPAGPGRAFVYQRIENVWQQAAVLESGMFEDQNDAAQGSAVAIGSGWAAVGSPNSNGPLCTFSGAVNLWQRTGGTWTYRQRLSRLQGSCAQHGISLDIDGEWLAVGAQAAFESASYVGVYRFVGSSAMLVQTVTPPIIESDSRFGNAVAVSGDTLVVGEIFRNRTGAADAGAAHVYRYDGTFWNYVTDLGALVTLAANDQFGIGVDINGDRCIVGALGSDIAGTDNGAAYVFQRSSMGIWSLVQTLSVPSGGTNDQFGRFVQIEGDVAVVGSNVADPGGIMNAGAAYVYRFDGALWNQESVLTHPDAEADDQFGASPALEGSTLAVGAPLDDVDGFTNAGTVRVLDLDPTGLTVTDQPDAAAVSPGAAAMFSTAVTGTGPIVYRWRRNGQPLLENFPFSGVATPTLTINPTFAGFDGIYDCVISNVCGSMVTTDAAMLTVPGCPSDISGNGEVGLDDIAAILKDWGLVCP